MICNFLQLSAYIDNELNPSEHETLTLHLSQCVDCQQKLSSYQQNRFWLKEAYQQWLHKSRGSLNPMDLRPNILARLHEGMVSDLQLSLYLDREVTWVEQQQIETHLNACSLCASAYHSLEKARDWFRSGKPMISVSTRDLSESVLSKIETVPHTSTLTHLSSAHLGDKLSAYLDKDLPEALQVAFDQHCATCVYCAQQVKQMQSAMKLLKSAHESTQNWVPEDEPTYPKFMALPQQLRTPSLFTKRTFWAQAAMVLVLGILVWKAPWWNFSEHDLKFGQKHSPNTSSKSGTDSLWIERMGWFQKNLEMALASFPKASEVSNRVAIEESLKKIEDCLEQSEKQVAQNKMTHNPFEGDLCLVKAILLELKLKTYGGFLEPSVLAQKLNEIKQLYLRVAQALERPFSLTHFRLPSDFSFRNLAQRYDQTSVLLEAIKKILLQLQEEFHQ